MPLIHPAAIYLEEVARHGSVRRAAERLHVSASAVNRQIINLEAEYGVALFERLPRGMRLTAAGETLVRDVRRWRREHERARDHLLDLQGLRRGSVSIGMMECFATHLIPDVLGELARNYPLITLRTWVGGTETIVEKLTGGTLDIAIAFNMPDHPDIEPVARLEQPLGVVLAADHPLASAQRLQLSQCIDYPLVLPDHDLSSRAVLDALLQRKRLAPWASLTSNSIEQMKHIIARSRCVALMSGLDVHDEVQSGQLVFVPLAAVGRPTERLVLARRRHGVPAPALQVVIDRVESVLRDAVASSSATAGSAARP